MKRILTAAAAFLAISSAAFIPATASKCVARGRLRVAWEGSSVDGSASVRVDPSIASCPSSSGGCTARAPNASNAPNQIA